MSGQTVCGVAAFRTQALESGWETLSARPMPLCCAASCAFHVAAAPPGVGLRRPALALNAGRPFLRERQPGCLGRPGRGAPREGKRRPRPGGERLRAGAGKREEGGGRLADSWRERRPGGLTLATGLRGLAWASCPPRQAGAAARNGKESDHTPEPGGG